MNVNRQPPELRASLERRAFDLHSIFYTVQGEGPFVGVPAIFVRLAGCNLQCPGCDTDYTQGRKRSTHSQTLAAARRLFEGSPHPKLLVLTGGEPFRQAAAIPAFVSAARRDGYQVVQIETNGSLGVDGKKDPTTFPKLVRAIVEGELAVVCSPKMHIVSEDVQKLMAIDGPWPNAYKYVLSASSVYADDGLPMLALGHGKKRVFRPSFTLHPPESIYLQPMDEYDERKNSLNREAVVRSCLRYGYRLCLQTHKYLGLE